MALRYEASLRLALDGLSGSGRSRANAQNRAIYADLGSSGAAIRVYAGTLPADAGAPLGRATLLLEVPLTGPPFPSIARGDALPIALASGRASFFRVVTEAGATKVQGLVSAAGGGGDVQLSPIDVSAGSAVRITSVTITP